MVPKTLNYLNMSRYPGAVQVLAYDVPLLATSVKSGNGCRESSLPVIIDDARAWLRIDEKEDTEQEYKNALAGNRTRAPRVAGEDSTTEPPMLR